MNKIITSDDILGKEAVDSEGEILGVVMKLHIDKQDKKMVGVTIDQGFMKPDLFVGMEYIRNFGVDSVFLNTVPHNKFKGLNVLTFDGHNVGKVIDIALDGNRLSKLIVAHSALSKEKVEIPTSAIKEIGASVILKPKYENKGSSA